MRALVLALLLLSVAGLPARAAESAPVRSSRATASLIAETDSVAEGQPLRVALRLRLAPGWHTYWSNPGDAGVAPALAFTLPAGVTTGPVAWPAPEPEQEGPLGTYAYRGEVVLPVTLRGATGATTVELQADWLVCKNICVPESGQFHLDLPGGDGQPSAQAALFAAADARTPRPSPFAARIAPDGTLFVAGLTGVRDAWFAPDAAGRIVASARQTMVQTTQGLALRLRREAALAADAPLSGVLTLRDAGGQESFLHVAATPGAVPAADGGIWRLLGLAVLGGMALNLMPCVFPVLALKTIGLAGLAGARRRQAVIFAASYAAGVLVAFAALGAALLALRAAGAAAGWGFQFQSPAFVAVVAWVLFAVGLNLSGVFRIDSRLAGAGQALTAREGPGGSFFTGLLAVVVATPCTAPFMGAAVAGALAAPPAVAMALFVAIGVGLALPYLVLALIPGVARALPRPGRWMELLRKVFALPMYVASGWLIWVLHAEAGRTGVLAALAGLVLVGLAGCALRLAQVRAVTGPGRGRRAAQAAAAVAGLAALAVLASIDATPARRADAAETFTAARLAALQQAGRPVFVDATAAWCVTCLVNEQVALTAAPVRRAFAAAGVTYLRADWTRQDPDVTAFLRLQARDGVPLYVFFPADHRPPMVLPQILTQAIVLDAIGMPAG
jgi:thiol:disulfide interchange protein DsbD